MPAASVSTSWGQAASGVAAVISASYSGRSAGTSAAAPGWPALLGGPSRITTIVRTVVSCSRMAASTGHTLSSTKITESPAWLMM